MNTDMNIRIAILRAADQIMHNPQTFDFDSCVRPDGCGTPGCALGWISVFANRFGINPVRNAANLLLPDSRRPEAEFYDRMRMIETEHLGVHRGSWHHKAEVCARALRVYADLFHPAAPTLEDDHELSIDDLKDTQEFLRQFEGA